MASLIAYLLMVVRNVPRVRKNKYDIPLPKVCHLEIAESTIGNCAVFVIGDVHGCWEEMCELQGMARALENDIIYIFVGDLVNKGPDSPKVLRTIRGMGLTAYSVRGNHEEGVLREVRSYRNNDAYVLPKSYEWIKELDNDTIEFLSELPYTISIPSLKTLVVHAGIVPGRPLEFQCLKDLTNMRNIIDEGDPFEGGGLVGTNQIEKGVRWVSLWHGKEHVYFGHDARRKLQLSDYATGLDTGCLYGGELTGVFINGCRKRLSVKSRQTLHFVDE